MFTEKTLSYAELMGSKIIARRRKQKQHSVGHWLLYSHVYSTSLPIGV
jgi:hypothetical protein